MTYNGLSSGWPALVISARGKEAFGTNTCGTSPWHGSSNKLRNDSVDDPTLLNLSAGVQYKALLDLPCQSYWVVLPYETSSYTSEFRSFQGFLAPTLVHQRYNFGLNLVPRVNIL